MKVTTKYHLPKMKPKLKYSIEKNCKNSILGSFFVFQYTFGLSLFVAATCYAVWDSCKTHFRARLEIMPLLAIKLSHRI